MCVCVPVVFDHCSKHDGLMFDFMISNLEGCSSPFLILGSGQFFDGDIGPRVDVPCRIPRFGHNSLVHELYKRLELQSHSESWLQR